MQCPKCKNNMLDISNESYSAMKCEGCSGLWFRDGDHEIAKTIDDIEDIDEDNERSASVYNKVRDIYCPECNEKMFKMIDRDQMQIEFEACANCNGVYFDSGEFKDIAENSLLERVKQTFDTLISNLKG